MYVETCTTLTNGVHQKYSSGVYHAVWIVQGKNVLCTLRLVSNTLGEADNLRFRNIFKFDKSKC